MVAKTTKKAKAGEKAAKKKAVAKKTTKKAPSNKKASSVKMKLFRDTVHGYIEIPEQYCDKLIDTPEFQRLRRIEQTSMRVLYPCARHDRFSHSLGVYHLGSIACRHMLTNSKDQIEKSIPSPSNREKLKRSFEIACLLHDVGHSPFSHSFEKYFDIPENLDQRLIDAVGNSDKEFKPDLKRVTPKEHERASALLVLAKFKNEIKNLNADPVLVVRMIIGCRYHKHVTAYEEICNCLIDLLNGKAIDVDKLDYVSRDKWASGTNSSNVDLHRLLSSVCLRKHSSKLKICFYKSALSVVESVLEAKNFQYLWIFSHHKVAYDQYVLKKAVETLALNLVCEAPAGEIDSDSSVEASLSKLFSVETFMAPLSLGGKNLYLLCDDDLIHLMKDQYITGKDTKGYIKEWVFRQHRLVPLWKSYAEYSQLFAGLDEDYLKKNGQLHKTARDSLQEFISGSSFKSSDVLVVDQEQSVAGIRKNQILIAMDTSGSPVCLTELGLGENRTGRAHFFFYVYVHQDLYRRKGAIIKALRDQL